MSSIEVSDEFKELLRFSQYEQNSLIYSWISLINIPLNFPRTHLDCIGWFELYRTKALERFLPKHQRSNLKKGEDLSSSSNAVLVKGSMEVEPDNCEVVVHDRFKIQKFENNPRFLQLSKSLSVDIHFMNGKKVTAKMPIKAGEILAKDPAYAVLNFPASMHKCHENHKIRKSVNCIPCSYCLTLIHFNKGLSCTNCEQMLYCTTTCRNLANEEFHKNECGAFDGLELDLQKACHQKLVLTIRAICRLGPEQAYKTFCSGSYPEHQPCTRIKKFVPGSYNGHFDSQSIRSVMHMGLSGNFGDLSNPELCSLAAIEANVVIRILETATEFFNEPALNNDKFKRKIGGLAFQILLGLKGTKISMTNRKHCIVLEKAPALERTPLEHTNGVGIFPTVSLLNHSCIPNSFLAFHERTCYVIATRPIDTNEEITISWIKASVGGKPELLPVQERLTLLRKSTMDLRKICFCSICVERNTYTDLSPTPIGFSCQSDHCNGEILGMALHHVSGLTFKCWMCGCDYDFSCLKQNIMEIVWEFEREKKLYSKGNYKLSPHNTFKAITTLYQYGAHTSQLTYKLAEFLMKLVTYEEKFAFVHSNVYTNECI